MLGLYGYAAILRHHWKLSIVPTPATPSSISYTAFIADFACISVKSCVLAKIKSQIIMHTYIRTHARTYVHIATYLRTHVMHVRFMKQPVIDVCFNYQNSRRYMGFRCLSHHNMRASNAQTSLCIHAASLEHLLLSFTKQMGRCR